MASTESRTSKKRTRGNDLDNDYIPGITNDCISHTPVYRSYSVDTSSSSAVTVISAPTSTKLSHGSRINLDVRARPRTLSAKKKCIAEQIFHHADSASKHPHEGSLTQRQQRQHEEKPAPKPILTPCHICYRRPTMRSQLDAYADCELCGKRTCYICLRECDGPDCRMDSIDISDGNAAERDPSGRRMCSHCAVEVVTDSGTDVVWCVHCVQRGGNVCHDDEWMGG